MNIMSNRTGGIMCAQVQTGAGSGLTRVYPFYYCLWLHIFTSVAFYQGTPSSCLHSVYALFNLIICHDSSYTVTFKCSFTFAALLTMRDKNIFIRGKKRRVLYALATCEL